MHHNCTSKFSISKMLLDTSQITTNCMKKWQELLEFTLLESLITDCMNTTHLKKMQRHGAQE